MGAYLRDLGYNRYAKILVALTFHTPTLKALDLPWTYFTSLEFFKCYFGKDTLHKVFEDQFVSYKG